MKTILMMLVALSVTFQQVYAVACGAIRVSGYVTYHNWSGTDYDVSSHYITLNHELMAVSALTIISGSLTVPAGGDITFSGFGFKQSAMVTPGSIALWGSNDTSIAANMVDYVQWGDSNQAFESDAILVGLWSANDYLTGEPDYVRNTYNFTFPRSGEWSSLNTGIADNGLADLLNLNITPNPFQSQITVQVGGNSNFDVSVMLYNANGAVIDQVHGIREENVPLAEGRDLPAGVYFIRVESLDGSYITRKVLKY